MAPSHQSRIAFKMVVMVPRYLLVKKNEMALSHQFRIKNESSQSRNSSMYHLHVLHLCNTKQKNKDRLFLLIIITHVHEYISSFCAPLLMLPRSCPFHLSFYILSFSFSPFGFLQALVSVINIPNFKTLNMYSVLVLSQGLEWGIVWLLSLSLLVQLRCT